ncbi:hypothetical protein NQZ68_000442 [Dissostichus eleginoides]|nr:hypothetical protein NQZ68_000442 [Dissostichus eleginoides]
MKEFAVNVNRLNVVYCVSQKLQTPFILHLKIPLEDKSSGGAWALSPGSMHGARGRHTDRCCGQSTVMTGRLFVQFAFALNTAEIPGLCAALGCYTTGTTSQASRSTLKINSCTTMGKMKSHPFK